MNFEPTFQCLASNRNALGDGIGYVELWNGYIANLDHEMRAQVVSKVASLSYGNDEAKNPQALFERLVKMGHLSCLEFVPVRPTNNMLLTRTLRSEPKAQTIREIAQAQRLLRESAVLRMTQAYEKTFAMFKIKIPIYIARQFMRHRAFSYLELSRRYVADRKVRFEFYNRPGRTRNTQLDNMLIGEYLKRIDAGERPETARGIIPLEAYTEFWCAMCPTGYANFKRLRLDAHAQGEIRQVAQAMDDLLRESQQLFWDQANRAEKVLAGRQTRQQRALIK